MNSSFIITVNEAEITWVVGGVASGQKYVTLDADIGDPWVCTGGADASLHGVILQATSGLLTPP